MEAEEAAKFYCSIFPDSHVDAVNALPASEEGRLSPAAVAAQRSLSSCFICASA